MATELPSLEIISSSKGDIDLVVDIPAGFDQVLGRDASADVTVPDPAVSRRHARIYRGADAVWMEDLGSTNGTYINGDRLTVPYRLRDGDEIKLGNTQAIFHDASSAPDATEVIAVPGVRPSPVPSEVGRPPREDPPEVASRPDPVPAEVVAVNTRPPDAAIVPSEEPVGAAAIREEPSVADPGPSHAAPIGAPDAAYAVPVVTPDQAPPTASKEAGSAPDNPSPVGGRPSADLLSGTPASAPPSDAGGPKPSGVGNPCPDCETSNRFDAWFCSRCGRELRPLSFPVDERSQGAASTNPGKVMSPYGGMGRQQFHQTMRARNGGRRAPYNESLAIPTILFRGLLVLLVFAVIVAALVIVGEGVHRVLGI
jgi:FHA domain